MMGPRNLLVVLAVCAACFFVMNAPASAQTIPCDGSTCTRIVLGDGDYYWRCGGVMVTQVADTFWGDMLDNFACITGQARVRWRFTSGAGNDRYAYYSAPITGGSIVPLTQLADTFWGDMIDSFRHGVGEYGNRATWRYTAGAGNDRYAYYSSDITSGAQNPVTQVADTFWGDMIQSYQVGQGGRLNRAIWMFTAGAGNDRYGYYTNALNSGAPVPITGLADTFMGESIQNFVVNGDTADYDFCRPGSGCIHQTRAIPTFECTHTDTSCGSYPGCANCNSNDGWYCSGANRESRNYYCSGGVSCAYSVTSSTACRTDAADSDGGAADYLNQGTCTDYTGCTGSACSSTASTDVCSSGTALTEYYVSGSGCASASVNCVTLYGAGSTCSGGRCVPAPCTRTAPLVTLAPSPQSGNPGNTLSYTVSVTNRDSATCGSSTFSMTYACPAGWMCSYTSSSLVIAPGASGSTTLNVQSSAGATAGSYTATSTASATSVGSGTGTYTVVIPCTRSNPTVTMSGTQTGAPGDSRAYTVTVRNNDVGCAAATFTLTSACPSGWTCTMSSGSLTLASGATGSATLTATSPGSATNGDYTLTATATAGAYTASGSTVYRVVVPCTRANPTVALSPGTQTGAPGDSRAYTASVTNNDNAACGASSFTMTSSCPAGWTCSYSSGSISVTPGTPGTTTLTATSPGTASDGTYTVTSTATNSGAAAYAASGSAGYVVATPCTRGNPAVSLSPATQSGGAGQLRTYSVTVTNTDNSPCGASAFTLTEGCPAGWTCIHSSSSFSLGAGASNTVTLSVTSSATASIGSYAITSSARNGGSGIVGSGTATYDVVCVRANPTVAIAPASQSGNPGQARSYTVTVTNNDNPACAASTFTMTSGCPAGGWACSYASASMSVSPGASSTTTLDVTSAGAATAGSYPFTATATNSGAAAYTNTQSASYVVVIPCIRNDPTVLISPGSQSGNPGQTRSYTVTVTNNDNAVCGSSAFSMTYGCPAGWTCAYSSSSFSLASGATNSVTLDVTPSATALAGANTITATGTNTASTRFSWASANYQVTCTRANPTVALAPASRSAAPGDTVTYTLSLTNNDNAACGSSPFSISAACPGGWSCTFPAGTLTVNYGATGTAALTVVTPGTEAPGVFTVQSTGTNNNANTYTSSGSAQLTLAICLGKNCGVPCANPATGGAGVCNGAGSCYTSPVYSATTCPLTCVAPAIGASDERACYEYAGGFPRGAGCTSFENLCGIGRGGTRCGNSDICEQSVATAACCPAAGCGNINRVGITGGWGQYIPPADTFYGPNLPFNVTINGLSLARNPVVGPDFLPLIECYIERTGGSYLVMNQWVSMNGGAGGNSVLWYRPASLDGRWSLKNCSLRTDFDNNGGWVLASDTVIHNFSVDATPPVSSVSAPADGARVGPKFTLSIAGSDNLAGVRCYDVQWGDESNINAAGMAEWGMAGHGISCTTATSMEIDLSTAPPTDPSYCFRVRALDNAGNTGSWSCANAVPTDTSSCQCYTVTTAAPSGTGILALPRYSNATNTMIKANWSVGAGSVPVRCYQVQYNMTDYGNPANTKGWTNWTDVNDVLNKAVWASGTGYGYVNCTSNLDGAYFRPALVTGLLSDDENRFYSFRARAVADTVGFSPISGWAYSPDGVAVDRTAPTTIVKIFDSIGTELADGDSVMGNQILTFRVIGDPSGTDMTGVNWSGIRVTALLADSTTGTPSFVNQNSCGTAACDLLQGPFQHDYNITYVGNSIDRAGNPGTSATQLVYVGGPIDIIRSARELFMILGSMETVTLTIQNRQDVNEELNVTVRGDYTQCRFTNVGDAHVNDERSITVKLLPRESKNVDLLVYTADIGEYDLNIYANSTIAGHDDMNEVSTMKVRIVFPAEFPELSWPAAIALLALAAAAYYVMEGRDLRKR